MGGIKIIRYERRLQSKSQHVGIWLLGWSVSLDGEHPILDSDGDVLVWSHDRAVVVRYLQKLGLPWED